MFSKIISAFLPFFSPSLSFSLSFSLSVFIWFMCMVCFLWKHLHFIGRCISHFFLYVCLFVCWFASVYCALRLLYWYLRHGALSFLLFCAWWNSVAFSCTKKKIPFFSLNENYIEIHAIFKPMALSIERESNTKRKRDGK